MFSDEIVDHSYGRVTFEANFKPFDFFLFFDYSICGSKYRNSLAAIESFHREINNKNWQFLQSFSWFSNFSLKVVGGDVGWLVDTVRTSRVSNENDTCLVVIKSDAAFMETPSVDVPNF